VETSCWSWVPPAPRPERALKRPGPRKQTKPRIATWVQGLLSKNGSATDTAKKLGHNKSRAMCLIAGDKTSSHSRWPDLARQYHVTSGGGPMWTPSETRTPRLIRRHIAIVPATMHESCCTVYLHLIGPTRMEARRSPRLSAKPMVDGRVKCRCRSESRSGRGKASVGPLLINRSSRGWTLECQIRKV